MKILRDMNSVLDYNPASLFIMSGGYYPVKEKGYLQPPAYSIAGTDNSGLVTGARYRVWAAAEIYHCLDCLGQLVLQPYLITMSKYRTDSLDDLDKPTCAEVYAEELIRRHVDSHKIAQIFQSTTTQAELVNMINLSVMKGWKYIAAITSDYHIPRVQAMYEVIEEWNQDDEFFTCNFAEFKKNSEIALISAEDILSETNHHFKYLINKVRSTDDYQKRLISEHQGVLDIRNGTYKH